MVHAPPFAAVPMAVPSADHVRKMLDWYDAHGPHQFGHWRAAFVGCFCPRM
jgi:hypothetical protein